MVPKYKLAKLHFFLISPALSGCLFSHYLFSVLFMNYRHQANHCKKNIYFQGVAEAS